MLNSFTFFSNAKAIHLSGCESNSSRTRMEALSSRAVRSSPAEPTSRLRGLLLHELDEFEAAPDSGSATTREDGGGGNSLSSKLKEGQVHQMKRHRWDMNACSSRLFFGHDWWCRAPAMKDLIGIVGWREKDRRERKRCDKKAEKKNFNSFLIKN